MFFGGIKGPNRTNTNWKLVYKNFSGFAIREYYVSSENKKPHFGHHALNNVGKDLTFTSSVIPTTLIRIRSLKDSQSPKRGRTQTECSNAIFSSITSIADIRYTQSSWNTITLTSVNRLEEIEQNLREQSVCNFYNMQPLTWVDSFDFSKPDLN